MIYLNGKLICRVGELGTDDRAFCQQAIFPLSQGSNCLLIIIWRLGEFSQAAQTANRLSGVAVQAMDPEQGWRINTGVAHWEVCRLDGLYGIKQDFCATAGYPVVLQGRFFDIEGYAGWHLASVVHESTAMPSVYESLLPPMEKQPLMNCQAVYADDGDDSVKIAQHRLNESYLAWGKLLAAGQTIQIPAHRKVRILLDLGCYACVYSTLHIKLLGTGTDKHRTIWWNPTRWNEINDNALMLSQWQNDRSERMAAAKLSAPGGQLSLRFAEALFEDSQVERFQGRKCQRDQLENLYFFGRGDVFVPELCGKRCTFTNLSLQAVRYFAFEIITTDVPMEVGGLAFHHSSYPLKEEGYLFGAR